MPPTDKKLKTVLREYQTLRQIWRADPVLYAQQRLGMNPTGQQQQALMALVPPGARVSARAGHGVGKTGFTAAAIWWFLECFDYAKVPCTAPSRHQLETVLWAELAKWLRRSDVEAEKNGLPPLLYLSALFDLHGTTIRDKGAPKEWFAVARTSRKETPDALQGFHASNIDIIDDKVVERDTDAPGGLLFVIEEASGVPDAIFEVVEGALASPDSRQLMIGNPVRNTGYFADSHKKNRGDFAAFHFPCAESPLVDPGYRQGLVRKYGEGSNVVRVRADGQFPRQDDDVLIALEWAESCLDREARPIKNATRRLGVDPARFGDDRTVLILRNGPSIEHIHIVAKLDTREVTGLVLAKAREWKAEEIYVDEIGIGAGVADGLREAAPTPVLPVNVAETAPERGEGQEKPRLLRDYLWLEMRDWLRDEEPWFIAEDRQALEDLTGELTTPKYGFDSSGRLVVESKDEMKKRLKYSPDIADALGTTFAPPPVQHSTSTGYVSF